MLTDSGKKYIDWIKTGKNLHILRSTSLELRRNVCSALNRDKGGCDGNCEVCRYDMDSSISRAELALLFHISEDVIFNWECGKTPVSLEDMLYYVRLADVKLEDIVVYKL